VLSLVAESNCSGVTTAGVSEALAVAAAASPFQAVEAAVSGFRVKVLGFRV
jgi:hypothetical protein